MVFVEHHRTYTKYENTEISCQISTYTYTYTLNGKLNSRKKKTMERFAIINDKIRLNLYNICRLCGIDNPCKIKILDSLKTSNETDEEPCLSKKIECVVGIKVLIVVVLYQTICRLLKMFFTILLNL